MAAKRFSAEVSAARLVRGVTTSTTATSDGGAGRLNSSAMRMRHPVRRSLLDLGGTFGELARRGCRQTMLRLTLLARHRQAPSAGDLQTFTLAPAHQILPLFR